MSDATDDKKVARTVESIMKILNKAKLNIPELIVLYGNMGYHIGASMAGLQSIGQGPGIEELKREYYSKPSVDLGLMLQGLLITEWEKDYLTHPQLSKYKQQSITKKE